VPDQAVRSPTDTGEQSRRSHDEDEANKTTREDLLAFRRSESLQRPSPDDQKNVEDHHGPHGFRDGDDVVTPSESGGKIGHVEQPSYVRLYDEHLIENNMRCYIQ